MAIENLILDGQTHALFSEKKHCQNSIIRDENIASQYNETV